VIPTKVAPTKVVAEVPQVALGVGAVKEREREREREKAKEKEKAKERDAAGKVTKMLMLMSQ